MTLPIALLGDPSKRRNPRALEWLKSSKVMAVGWTAMRVWLGAMWIQAGVDKLWGAENAAFLHHDGAGVAGFAAHGVPAYTWWGSFLHGFVVPNAGWIGVLVAVAEFTIGVALVAGLFTRLAALGSLALLFTYVMSGTASVCGFYALFAVVVLYTWRTSSWIGVDGAVARYRQQHPGQTVHYLRLLGTGNAAGVVRSAHTRHDVAEEIPAAESAACPAGARRSVDRPHADAV